MARYGIISFGQPHDLFGTFALFMSILTMIIVMLIWIHFVTIQTWQFNNYVWHMMLKQEVLEPLFLAAAVALARAMKHGYSFYKTTLVDMSFMSFGSKDACLLLIFINSRM